MQPKLIDTIKAFLDYNAHVDGVSFHNALFIFLSNAGGNVIAKVALDSRREGTDREELRMNSKEMETKIFLNIFNDEKGGFLQSSLMDHHLVDHYIPFLPLELKHVRQCVMAEMVHLNMTEDIGLAEKVARDMPFFPEKEKIFSVKGCKSVRQNSPSELLSKKRNRKHRLKEIWVIRFHLLLVVLLVSNITLSTGFLDVIAAAVSYVVYTFFERDGLLPFDPKGLEKDLRDSVYGQHIVSDVVLKSVTSFMTDSKPNKPLVLSFHGTTGVGKNHVAKIIARNIYEKGENSKHVHMYISEHHFPHKEKSDLYSAQLKQWISESVSSFPRSMFIFDEMDKMQPKLIDTIKAFLPINAHVDGVSFHNALFIFLSNAGGNVIAEVALDSRREGKDREKLWMNSKEMETRIFQNIFNDKNSGFLQSSLIAHHLVDHYIPFLPLELKHVRQCVMAEMVHLNMTEDIGLAEKVARDMPTFPKKEKIFSVKGCKTVRQKLFLQNG
ncbi:unnamed protein product [Leuciscus chuanchicus]